MLRSLVAAALCVATVWPALAAPPSQEELREKVEAVREEAGLVALGAVIADAEGEILGLAVTGKRQRGSRDAAQPGDAWHIGSNTKMLTALLYARLVEQGKAEWGATLPDLLPDLADSMDPAWNEVTIEQLLSHRSGLPANPGPAWFMTSRFDSADTKAQRTKLARGFLSDAPEGEPGDFLYSNLGYMIAGAALDRIAERLGEDDYETLFLARLVPEGEGWGFGPPETGIEGHAKGLFGGLKAQGTGVGADNPAALAPAGTAHVPLEAHARFLSSFLTPDTMQEKLLGPFPDESSTYALGWGVSDLEPFGRAYVHNGSNTMWLSSVWLVPEAGVVVIVDTNSYTDDAIRAVTDLSRDLVRLYAGGGD